VIKLLHVITDLDTGGAERMLHKLLVCRDSSAFDAEVVSLTDVGAVGREIEKLGVTVRALGMRPGTPDPVAILRLARWLRQDRVRLVQTWMYHADLIGGMAARLAGGTPVVWNIRHTNLDPRSNKRGTIQTARLCARLSVWLPKRIVCCSEATRSAHVALGYDAGKMIVIPNGFDLRAFCPDPSARSSVRTELGIPEDVPLIGLVGRFHPEKDHRSFVEAAGHLSDLMPAAHYLLCGLGTDWDNSELAGWIDQTGARRNWHLLGGREDVARIFAALDIAVSSSVGEGFPNVLGEAMACEVPCVVTDVGDSAWIVGDTGRVVPPRQPIALAEACFDLLEMDVADRRQLGLAARARINQHFHLPDIVGRYERLYRELAA
jgi:glycosyltransferase involved in cell wall biosynthesis